ncbi:hypothetical protein Trydic_g21619 [Trypoxylus dichotomus]
MAQWTVQHRVFAVQYSKSNEPVITVEWLLCTQLNVPRKGSIPDRNTIIRWVETSPTTGSVMREKSLGRPLTVRIPENVDRQERLLFNVFAVPLDGVLQLWAYLIARCSISYSQNYDRAEYS